MKTNSAAKTIVLLAAVAIVMVLQWRTASRLRHDNRELQGVQEQASQLRIELEQAMQNSAQHESEAQTLRFEVDVLRSELQAVRFDLEFATNAAKQTALAEKLSRAGLNGGGPSGLRPADPHSSSERRFSHLYPSVLTNLPTTSHPSSYNYRAGGYIDGVQLWNGIPEDSVRAGGSWSPSEPLPLTFRRAEEIARGELRQLVHDEARWEITGISLHRSWGLPETWHYRIGFGGPLENGRRDHFSVHVSFSGATGSTFLGPIR